MAGRFVIDNSVVMAWFFSETSSDYTNWILDLLTDHLALAPAVWPLETVNVLLVGERRRRIQHAHVMHFLRLLRSLPIAVEQGMPEVVFGDVYLLARTTGLSSYDASYLELAIRESIPLATLDDELRSAARKCGVPIMEP